MSEDIFRQLWEPVLSGRDKRGVQEVGDRLQKLEEKAEESRQVARPIGAAGLSFDAEPIAGTVRQRGLASLDMNVDTKKDTLSAQDISGGAGLPAGYTFEEFTICDSGEPATRWWPTWLTNPEA